MNCPGCGSIETYFSTECPTRPMEAKNTGKLSFVYLACSNCGLVFQKDTLPSDYYKANYRRNLPAASEFVTEGNVTGEHRRAEKVERYLRDHNLFFSWVLDIGSSTGEMLRYLQRFRGCQIVGVEPSDAFREYSIQQGTSTFSEIKNVEGIFSLVTCVHVLEHQEHPKEFLEEVKKHVSRLLYVEVPFLQPNLPHALMFTLDSLVGMIERAGFKVLHKEHSDDNNLRILCTLS